MASKDPTSTTDGASNDRSYRGDSSGRVGIISDKRPDVVASNGDEQEVRSDCNGPSDTDSGDQKRPS